MKIKLFGVFVLSFIFSSFSNAYLVAVMDKQQIDYAQRTHILIGGNPKELGPLLLYAAQGKIKKYQEMFPEDQIVLIASSNYPDFLKKIGFKILKNTNAEDFDDSALLKSIKPFQKIASLDTYTHSNPVHGILLQGWEMPWSDETPGFDSLKSKFTEDAFAGFWGCNSGFYTAPRMATKFGIPIVGSLTSTDFQYLYEDGNYYRANDGQKDIKRAQEDLTSYVTPFSCVGDKCLRLKPDKASYSGLWGNITAGSLPFYKMFCPKGKESPRCLKAMVNLMRVWVGNKNLTKSLNFNDYKETVIDYLCPVSGVKNVRQECAAVLEANLTSQEVIQPEYKPFSGKMMSCALGACEFYMKCKKFFGYFIPGSCQSENTAKHPVNTLIEEFKRYMRAYQSY